MNHSASADVKRLREITSVFTGTPSGQVHTGTPIDLRAIGSIRVYKMTAAIAAETGRQVGDLSAVRTFGDLVAATGLPETAPGPHQSAPLSRPTPASAPPQGPLPAGILVGIDLEDIASLPVVADFREDPFYRATFSEREIAYCLLAEDPMPSFAGKFAAKEAIIKADNRYAGVPLREIEIANDELGRPCFQDFSLSISHSSASAVAVAIRAVPLTS